MKDIVAMTGRPKFVRDAVDKFINKIDNNFTSIHWRYNQDDWLHGSCSEKNKDSDRPMHSKVYILI